MSTEEQVYLVDLAPGLTILGSPPNGEVGVAYSYTFSADGGTPSYLFDLVSGPSWASIDATTGELTGTPDTAQNETFLVKVTDSDGQSVAESFTINVAAEPVVSTTLYLIVLSVDQRTVAIFDIETDPASPAFVGSVTDATNITSLQIVAKGTYIFAFSNDRLTTIDASDPSDPQVVNVLTHADFLGMNHGCISGNGNFLFGAGEKFVVIDITDQGSPTSPKVRGSVGHANWLASDFNIEAAPVGNQDAVVAAEDTDSLTYVDASDPDNPSVPSGGTYTESTYTNNIYGVATKGNYAIISSEIGDRVTAVDVSTPGAMNEVSTSSGHDAPRRVTIDGDLAAVPLFNEQAIAFFDVSNPLAISFHGQLTDSAVFSAWRATPKNGYCYTGVRDSNVLITIDATDPKSPTIANTQTSTEIDDPRDFIVHEVPDE